MLARHCMPCRACTLMEALLCLHCHSGACNQLTVCVCALTRSEAVARWQEDCQKQHPAVDWLTETLQQHLGDTSEAQASAWHSPATCCAAV